MSGPVGSSQWMYSSGAASFFSHTIDQSLRFEEADGANLKRDITSSSNMKIWTWSAWVKRTNLDGSHGHQYLFTDGKSSSLTSFIFNSSDQLYAQLRAGGSSKYKLSNQVFRDTSAWYHLVWRVDTTQATAEDRSRVYVNGTQITSWSTEQNVNQDTDSTINQSGNDHLIGGYSSGTSRNFNGYMAEVNFIDGISYGPENFGETSDGVWIPKQYSGSYGTNGFYLTFANSSAIGDDLSGNTNDFTPSNLVASDVVPDSPTNNFATMNPLMIGDARVHSSAVYSEGNLKVACGGFSTSTIGGGFSTIAIPKDKKIYCEVVEPNKAGNLWGAGVIIDNHVQASNQIAGNGAIAYYNRSVFLNGTENDYGSSAGIGGFGIAKLAAGDVLGIAVDGTTGKVWFHRNGTYFGEPQGHQSGAGTTGNPSAGTNEIGTINNTASINPSGEIFIFLTGNNTVDDLYVNFGQDSTFGGNKSAGSETDANGEGLFQYAVPTDYVCLHSGNMSDPTIGPGQDSQADDHFNTVLYTGTGSSQSITGVGFQPDFVWIKGRAARRHMLFDVIRGATNRLISDDDNYEIASSDSLTAFGSDGFTEGGNLNTGNNGESFISWNWKAGGSPSSNSDGSITSSVSANTAAGFSIVGFTGTGSNATVGHGLGSAPEMVIVKRRTSPDANWFIFHKDTGATAEVIYLNLTNQAAASVAIWNSTAPTNDVFSLGTGNSNTTSKDYIAYCFHSVEGYSKVGSYVGNASTDGPFVYTGFRPAWFLVRRESASSNWTIFDNKRGEVNEIVNSIDANLANVEETGTSINDVDFLSNGIKIREDNGDLNGSGGTMIYLCFAEAPFKFANAR